MGEVFGAAPRGKKTRLSLLQQRFWGSGNAKKDERLQRLRGCWTRCQWRAQGCEGRWGRCLWLRPEVRKPRLRLLPQ